MNCARTGPGTHPPACAARVRSGFTLIELLTVVAIIGVLATLLLSALASAKLRAQQTNCRNNLRQIALAVEMYHDDTGRRPRSFTRLSSRPTWLASGRSLVCPSDPALRSTGRKPQPPQAPPVGESRVLWGNQVNRGQEPQEFVNWKDEPEAGSYEAEMRETKEDVGFSYLHALGWQRRAWLKLTGPQAAPGQVGATACELHGVRIGKPTSEPNYRDFEGRTFRAQRDGAVITRKIFRVQTAAGQPLGLTGDSTITVPLRVDYPWEYYTDILPEK